MHHYLYAQALHQGDYEGLNQVAAHMAEHGHAEEAIKIFREIATVEADSLAVMLVNIGNAQINLGAEDAAAASFKEAIEADPSYALAYRRLGNLEDWNENPLQAAEYYVKACACEADNPLCHSSAGTAFLNCGEWQRAREFLSTSVRLLPEQPQVLYNLAVAHLKCEEPKEALARLTDAVRLDKGYFNGWFLKARLEVKMQMLTEAAQSVRQALAGSLRMPAEEAQKLRALALENGLRI